MRAFSLLSWRRGFVNVAWFSVLHRPLRLHDPDKGQDLK